MKKLYIHRLHKGGYQLFSAGAPNGHGYFEVPMAMLYASNNELICVETNRIFKAAECVPLLVPVEACAIEECQGAQDFGCPDCSAYYCEAHFDAEGVCVRCSKVTA